MENSPAPMPKEPARSPRSCPLHLDRQELRFDRGFDFSGILDPPRMAP